jgi:hypothetical protein
MKAINSFQIHRPINSFQIHRPKLRFVFLSFIRGLGSRFWCHWLLFGAASLPHLALRGACCGILVTFYASGVPSCGSFGIISCRAAQAKVEICFSQFYPRPWVAILVPLAPIWGRFAASSGSLGRLWWHFSNLLRFRGAKLWQFWFNFLSYGVFSLECFTTLGSWAIIC